MLCIVSAIVLGILSIFSVRFRDLFKEALKCALRRVTLRACDSSFGEKVKAKIVGSIINKSPKIAKIFNKYYEVFAWILFILMIISTIFVISGIVNFYLYGSCNGLNSTAFCVFDPNGDNNKITLATDTCPINSLSEKDLSLSSIRQDDYPSIKTNKKNANIIFIGCYSCENSRKAYTDIKTVAQNYKANITYIHFPVKDNTKYLDPIAYCASKIDIDKFWILNDRLYTDPIDKISDINYIKSLLTEIGYDKDKVMNCSYLTDTVIEVSRLYENVKQTGIYGTPTIFINYQAIVGPKPYRVYERLTRGW